MVVTSQQTIVKLPHCIQYYIQCREEYKILFFFNFLKFLEVLSNTLQMDKTAKWPSTMTKLWPTFFHFVTVYIPPPVLLKANFSHHSILSINMSRYTYKREGFLKKTLKKDHKFKIFLCQQIMSLLTF